MHIESVPNRSSPPAILLRESYREAGTVNKRTLANLSQWPPALVEGLRILLKGGTAVPHPGDAFDIIRSLPHGHVAAVLGTLKQLELDRPIATIDREVSTEIEPGALAHFVTIALGAHQAEGESVLAVRARLGIDASDKHGATLSSRYGEGGAMPLTKAMSHHFPRRQ